jgi:acetyltransferase-like isoleucine patch superfamily enzyme
MNISSLKKLYRRLYLEKKKIYKRSLSFGDYFTDRTGRAKMEGFGIGTSVYDNVLILGNVVVGKNCWIGPNCILDGSGNLVIGNNCHISAGVQIYSHHSVNRAVQSKNKKNIIKKTIIGNNVYIGPNSVISKGVIIGDNVIVGALSFVNRNIKSNSKFFNK